MRKKNGSERAVQIPYIERVNDMCVALTVGCAEPLSEGVIRRQAFYFRMGNGKWPLHVTYEVH